MANMINTPCGLIEGTTCKWPGVIAYKGIRYATAKRWMYPELVTSWEGVYDATKYGNCSPQPRTFYDEEKVIEKAFYYHEFRKGETYTYDEDCLFLNIWTPEDAKEGDNLPVLFYIHGGGFTGGCGHEKHFDGPVWPTKGVIGVTINYRLGPLGFACLPELKEESGHTGNYGLYDQLAALKWVFDNISSFGGDKNRITIMGQSAGAMSVQQMCLSPLSEGMVAGAVMSSGGGVSKMMSASKPENTYELWSNIKKAAGCSTLEEFRLLPVADLFKAYDKVKAETKGRFMACAPVLDGEYIVGTGIELLNSGKIKSIPYITGSNSEDIFPPMIFDMAKGWCKSQAEHGNNKDSFTYFFDRNLPGDKEGAWHSADLWYWFGTLDNCWRPMTDKDKALSCEMVDYLMNFCKSGNPNGEGLTEWKPMTNSQGKVLRWGDADTHMGKVSKAKLIKTMFTHKAVGE